MQAGWVLDRKRGGMTHRLEEQRAIEAMPLFKTRVDKLMLWERVVVEIWAEILDERAKGLPRDNRGFTEGTSTQTDNKTRRGENVSIPKRGWGNG
jgi:hypothetical protein